MAIVTAVCPQCGAKTIYDESRKRCYCTYCGVQLVEVEDSKTITIKTIDVARIKESEVHEHIEYLRDDQKKRREKSTDSFRDTLLLNSGKFTGEKGAKSPYE